MVSVSCSTEEQPAVADFMRRWRLGSSDLAITPLGISTYAWGDPDAGYGTEFEEEDLSMVC